VLVLKKGDIGYMNENNEIKSKESDSFQEKSFENGHHIFLDKQSPSNPMYENGVIN